MFNNFFLDSSDDIHQVYSNSYDIPVVIISVLIAIFASVCAFEMVERLSRYTQRSFWLPIGAVILGSGVWAMHFIGMLAFHLSCAMTYDPWISGLSMLPAIAAAAIALDVIASATVSLRKLVFGGIVMAVGIGIMHFSGMASIRLDGVLRYDPLLFIFSLVAASGLAIVALFTKFFLVRFFSNTKPFISSLVGGSMLGGAISSMHYIAMDAAYFLHEHVNGEESVIIATSPTILTVAVGVVAILLIFSGLLFTFLGAKIAQVRNRIEAILATTSQGFVVMDVNNIITECNLAMSAMVAIEQGTLVGKPYFDLIASDNIADMKGNYQVEATVRRIDGTTIPCLVHGNEITDERGEVIYFFALFTNISLRKNAQIALVNNEARLRAIIDTVIEGIITIDSKGIVETMNPATEKIFAYQSNDVIGQNINMLMPEPYHSRHDGYLLSYLTTGQAKVIGMGRKVNGRRKDGSVFPMELAVSEMSIDGKRMFTGLIRDITEREITENALLASESRFKTMFNEAPLGIALIDSLTGQLYTVNPMFAKIVGRTMEEMADIDSMSITHPDDIQEDLDNMALLNAGKISGFQMEKRYLHSDGTHIWINMTIAPVYVEDKAHPRHLCMIEDITERKSAEEQIKHHAFYDTLTQLPNRRLLQERLKYDIEMARRDDKQMAVLMLDLDRFKAVNDNFGHLAGDELLQQVAERINVRLRDVDMVARLGGDEFVVLLENITHPQDAARIAEEIIADLCKPFKLTQSDEVRIGASIGISLHPQHGDSPDVLMEHADAALYQAKDQGRGCFAYFSEDLTNAVRERIALEERLRSAIEQQELRVFYQPQVDMVSGRIIGAEALVRWHDPIEGLMPPFRFIPIAEETSLIMEIGEWVLRETCRQGRQWLDSGFPPITLAVNISPRQFRRSDINAMVTQVIAETGFPAGQLVLEMTENGLMDNQDNAMAILNNLHKQGIRLAIDDFGIGYSSLSLLKQFPLDVLKIDKCFIGEIPHNNDMDIASAIVAMGHSLGFKVIAEGVETVEQLAFLLKNGCDIYQGFIKSRPLPAEEFAVLLREQQLG
ncbi:MAG: EAL domain-containing protein [Methylococcales bacterium]|nr:EAL domain-containing protein [Methylococcaceae bacterium]